MRFRSRVLALLSSLATGVAMIALATPSAQALDLPPDKGAINGTITDSVTHAPVAQFCIQGPRSGDPMAYAYACSDSTGYYETMALTPGTYTIDVIDWNNGDYISQTLTVQVSAGVVTTRDITLVRGGVLTGRVVEDKTRQPLADICPQAYVERTGTLAGYGYPCSTADGTWTIKGLPTGNYTVQLTGNSPYGSPYLATWVGKGDSQAKATVFSVTVGVTTIAGTAKLAAAAILTGQVIDPAGQPVAGVIVAPEGGYDGRAGWGEGRWETTTGADGRYAVAVPAGTYTPFFYDVSGRLAPQWSGGAVTKSTGTAVTLKAAKSRTVDAQLRPASGLDVSAATAGGQPFTGYIAGLVYTTSGDYIGDFDIWPGGMMSTPLPSGTFVLSTDIMDENFTLVASLWYDGAPDRATATPVTLGVDEHKPIVIHVP